MSAMFFQGVRSANWMSRMWIDIDLIHPSGTFISPSLPAPKLARTTLFRVSTFCEYTNAETSNQHTVMDAKRHFHHWESLWKRRTIS